MSDIGKLYAQQLRDFLHFHTSSDLEYNTLCSFVDSLERSTPEVAPPEKALQPEYMVTGSYYDFLKKRPTIRKESLIHHWGGNCPECGQDLMPYGEVKPVPPSEEGPWELIDTKLDMYHKIVWIWRKIK